MGALACLALQGCMASWSGHGVPRDRLREFKPNQTSQSEVEAALGPPEDVVFKSNEQATVYVYRSVVGVQLGLPFPVSFGRSRQRGFSLNVMFKDGLFRGYELVEHKQKLLWR